MAWLSATVHRSADGRQQRGAPTGAALPWSGAQRSRHTCPLNSGLPKAPLDGAMLQALTYR